MWAASKRLRLWLKDFFLSLKDFSLSLSFFLPGLGVACDPQALGPPDHQSVYLVSAPSIRVEIPTERSTSTQPPLSRSLPGLRMQVSSPPHSRAQFEESSFLQHRLGRFPAGLSHPWGLAGDTN